MKKIFIILFFSTFFLFGDSEDFMETSHIPKDLSFLELNKSQKEILKEALKKHRKALKELHKEEELLEEELKSQFIKDKFDKKEFYQKSLRLKKRVIEIESNFFYILHSILDKKQREKFIEYIEEWEIE